MAGIISDQPSGADDDGRRLIRLMSQSENSGWIVVLITVSAIGLLAAIIDLKQGAQARLALKRACINNLRQIEGAKRGWSLEYKKAVGDIVTTVDLAPYLGRTGEFPVCPARGIYTIGCVGGDQPTCSVRDHVLPKSSE